MNGRVGDGSKVRAEHHARQALVYVRQSSLRQVRTNLESQRRQYEFAEQAAAMGWSRERIVVVDEDQGKSASLAQAREGFARLVSAVARGEVGIVMSLEISRLSRNDADWHHLVYLCRWTGTLIADEHGVYEPASSADRMVLGVRGQVSELERDNSVHRMVEARWNKARRGEAFTIPPAGYELNECQLELSSDETVQAAVKRVFAKFDELGAARQVFMWWREEGLPFPVRRTSARGHPVIWLPVAYDMVLRMLHHPVYAGAYVFGRSETRRQLDPESQRVELVRSFRRPDAWPVLIRDHHPAYITFEKYLQNQERMRGNMVMGPVTDDSHRGAAREGKALLQGLLRCGHCGRRMYVNYGGAKAARTLQYRCSRIRARVGPDRECQLVGGKRIEAAVIEAYLQATESAGAEAAALAGESLGDELAEARRAWQLQVEKAEYEAQRAERQYMAVEPENRTVARELERRWNEKLQELDAARARAARAGEGRRALSKEELTRARELGQQLELVWNASTTTTQDKKRLLRALIEEVQLRTDDKHHRVGIVWKGGAVTEREVVRLKGGEHTATSEDIIELVRRLALEFDDAQIARILNRQGRRSGLGLAFTNTSVSSMRHKHHIPVCPGRAPRDEREGPFTADEVARELGVTASTVHHWLRQGLLAGEQTAARAPWRIVLSEEVRRRLVRGDAPDGWVGLGEAAQQLGMSRSLVAYWVKQGKLPAVRTSVGKRPCWRIDVSSATSRRQTTLFEQKINANRKES
jgi:DNA invertase Pin-like site-specific DNA recombinase